MENRASTPGWTGEASIPTREHNAHRFSPS